MALTTLKPKLATLDTSQVKTLDTKAGATAMPGGRRWMDTRERVALRYGYQCAACGLTLMPGKLPDGRSRWECDHIIPRDDGGSNEETNLQPLCTTPCHEAKSAAEAKARSGR